MADDVAAAGGGAAMVAGQFGATPTRAGTVELELIGQWGGPTYAVEVVGDIAYIGSGPPILAIDITDPTNLSLLGQSDVLAGVVKDVALSGDHAYVAVDDAAGLTVIDISNPTAMVYAGGCRTTWGTSGVAVSGSYAYLAGGGRGTLHVVDISDPTAPQRVGWHDTKGRANDVAVFGG